MNEILDKASSSHDADFASVLEQLRDSQQISKKALAEKASLSPGYISLLTSGTKTPSLETVENLANALELSDEERAQFFKIAGYKPTPRRTMLKDSLGGVKKVYRAIRFDLLIEWMYEAKERVYFLTTWIEDFDYYSEAILTAAENGAEIKILLIDPQSGMSKLRLEALLPIPKNEQEDEAKFDKEKVERKVGKNLTDLRILAKKNPVLRDKLQIRLYKTMPAAQVIVCDNKAMVGFYSQGRRADLSPQLEIEDNTSVMGQFVKKEFEALWERPDNVII
jgi:transcriptional regulator with XRE-family HTH domain